MLRYISVCGQLRALAALTPKANVHDINCIGRLMDSTDSSDALVTRQALASDGTRAGPPIHPVSRVITVMTELPSFVRLSDRQEQPYRNDTAVS